MRAGVGYCPSKVKSATLNYIISGYSFQNKISFNDRILCCLLFDKTHTHGGPWYMELHTKTDVFIQQM